MTEATTLPPLLMSPHYRTVVWGGNRIAAFKSEAPVGDSIGESWEVSDMPAAQSVVCGGSFDGLTMSDLMERYAPDILGARLFKQYGHRFPLLVKFIDARRDLSVQVHPDDYMARLRHNSNGKTELWYTLEASDDAYIYSGLRESVTTDDLREHISRGTVGEVLARFKPSHGDYFYLPAGRIHSIGAGTMVLEIQQPSDITYRIFDYNRLDFDGRPRSLHIEEALEATDFRVHGDYMRHLTPRPGREQVLQECPYFTATVICTGAKPFTLPVARYLSFRVLVAASGSGTITDDRGNSVRLTRGHTVLVPASTSHIVLTPDAGCRDFEILTAYIQ